MHEIQVKASSDYHLADLIYLGKFDNTTDVDNGSCAKTKFELGNK